MDRLEKWAAGTSWGFLRRGSFPLLPLCDFVIQTWVLPVTARAASAARLLPPTITAMLVLSTTPGQEIQCSTAFTSHKPYGSYTGLPFGPSIPVLVPVVAACTEEEHGLQPELKLKPGHESTSKSNDSDITRKLIFLPLNANKMLLPDSC